MDALKSRIDSVLGDNSARLDRLMRPLQRAYFSCCHDCSDDTRPAPEVAACLSTCQAPISAVSAQMESASSLFQQRLGRCDQLSQEAAQDAPGSEDARRDAYLARMRPCVEEELGKMAKLLDGVSGAVPGAQREVERARAEAAGGGKRRVGVEVGEGKKGWW